MPWTLSEAPRLPEDLPYLRRIWDQHPNSRVAAYSPRIPAPVMADWLFHREVAPMKQPNATAFGLRSEHAFIGCASWRPLPWDSEQFGFPTGRLDVLLARGDYVLNIAAKLKLLSAVLEDCQRAGLRHLTARVDAGDLPTVHALERSGFLCIDAIQTFALELPGASAEPQTQGFELRGFAPADLEAVLSIARASYKYDRFHADPALSADTADAVNEAWLGNACAGQGADHVVIAADEHGVIGYVTCRLDGTPGPAGGAMFGTIVMVATAARARGRGVGMAATLAAVRWFTKRGVRVLEVGTQLRNIPAARLYQKCGFRQVAATLTFTRMLT